MRVIYPYNEILPTGRAHDVYLFNNCASLANAGLDVELLIGEGSPPNLTLYRHYNANSPYRLRVRRLPILRRNNRLNLSWNFVFHGHCQKVIEKERPDIVITSVLKQGIYHIKHRLPGIRYVYEVHQLEMEQGKHFKAEREMFAAHDLIVVTTESLKKVLQSAPYSLKTPIEVIGLATSSRPLGPKKRTGPLHAAYVGQLYPMQGVDLLIDAVLKAKDARLTIIGGTQADIDRLNPKNARITFHGFQAPPLIPQLLRTADVLLMPSRNLAHKPHVAHTKLVDYANLGRPMVAPDLPTVQEQLGSLAGVATYQPEDSDSLARCLKRLRNPTEYDQIASQTQPGRFTWEKRAAHYSNLLSHQLVH